MPALTQRRLFTVDDYHAMAEAGVLNAEDRVELIDGEILEMSPIGSRHAAHVNRLNRWLTTALGERAVLSVQNPVRLDDFAEPEPDLAVLRPRADFYAEAHPGPRDVLLLIEVSDSSLVFDRKVKLPLYAGHEIPEVWVVNLIEGQIEVYRRPEGREYSKAQTPRRGERLAPLAFPGVGDRGGGHPPLSVESGNEKDLHFLPREPAVFPVSQDRQPPRTTPWQASKASRRSRRCCSNVLAVDKEGESVLGLGKEDFVIEENGEVVEITGVSFYTTRYGPDGAPLEGADAIPSSRYFILFFHDKILGGSIGNYLVRQQTKARTACLGWVEEHLLPSDWVAVASFDLRLKLHQDFTQDRFAIAEGIRSATTRKNPDKGVGRRGRPLPPHGAPSLLRHLPRGKTLNKESRNLYDALRLVAEAAAYAVGRKNLLLFSTGFGELDANGLTVRADPRHYRPMEHALNDHNVAVYPIDLTPLEIRHLQGQLLVRLALGTGGYYYRDPINFLDPLQRISEENAGYYLISYQSAHPASAAGYQRVKVRARDRAIKLRARQGYRYGSEEWTLPIGPPLP